MLKIPDPPATNPKQKETIQNEKQKKINTLHKK